MNRTASFFLLLLLSSCSAKENEPANEAQALEQTVDSLNNANVDGTETTTGPPWAIKRDLPAPLKVNLDQLQNGWELPVLTDQDITRLPQEEQGPFFLQADFNGDSQTDYAVQIVRNDSATVLVLLKEKEGETYEEHLLQRKALHPIDGKNRSVHYLSLAKKSGKLHDTGTGKEITLPHDAISVGTGNMVTTFVYEDGKFRQYQTAD